LIVYIDLNQMPSLLLVLRALAALLARTDGRDKLAKFLQNYCRYRKHYARAGGASFVKFKRLQGSLSEFRSLLKFGKPIKNAIEVHEIITMDRFGGGGGGDIGGLQPLDCLRLASLVSDIGYKLGDNVEYLSHYKLLRFDERRCESWSKTFQFFAYLADVVVGWVELRAVEKKRKQYAESEGGEGAFERKRRAMRVGYLGDCADFLRVAPGFLAMYGLLGFKKKHDGFSGVMGLIVGATGVWKVWNKVVCDILIHDDNA
jgi:hypothetical protein